MDDKIKNQIQTFCSRYSCTLFTFIYITLNKKNEMNCYSGILCSSLRDRVDHLFRTIPLSQIESHKLDIPFKSQDIIDLFNFHELEWIVIEIFNDIVMKVCVSKAYPASLHDISARISNLKELLYAYRSNLTLAAKTYTHVAGKNATKILFDEDGCSDKPISYYDIDYHTLEMIDHNHKLPNDRIDIDNSLITFQIDI